MISSIIKKINSPFKWKLILGLSKIYDFNIRLVESEEELIEVYKFRYNIYVEQLQRKQKYANHVLKTIEEPLDSTAYNIGAWKNGKLVGVVRLNTKKKGAFDYYSDLYQINLFGDFINNSSIVTKLIVEKSYRKTPLAILLALACYRIACKDNIEINFIDCNTYLVKYFLMLGYRYYIPDIEHPDFGKVTPLVLINQDINYLRKVKSPFVSICQQHPFSSRATNFYNQQFLKFHKQQLTNKLKL